MIKALLITNPNSRAGGDTTLDEGITQLEQAGIQCIHRQTQSADETRDTIMRSAEEVDLVIIGGGDGTISSTAGTLLKTGLPFAILPLGTANDLARSLNIPAELPQAFEVIARNNRRKIDLASVNGKYFFNVANIGLGVDITHELTPELKKALGVLSYLKAFFSALSRRKSFRVTLTIDGKRYRQRSIHLGVGNGRYYGGGNVLDENSRIDDGLLRLYSLRPQSLWELLTLAPMLRDGKQNQTSRTFTSSGSCIEIKTRSRKEIDADGEPISHTPAKFEVLHQALEVIAPPQESPNSR